MSLHLHDSKCREVIALHNHVSSVKYRSLFKIIPQDLNFLDISPFVINSITEQEILKEKKLKNAVGVCLFCKEKQRAQIPVKNSM